MSRLDEIEKGLRVWDDYGYGDVCDVASIPDVQTLLRIARAAEKMRDMIEAVRESGDCGDIPYGWCCVDELDAAIKGES